MLPVAWESKRKISTRRSPMKNLTLWFLMLHLANVATAQPLHVVPNNTPGFVSVATDLGPVDPSSTIEVTAWLQLHNQNQLDQLLKSQNQPGSANYHKWITQDKFNASFS